MAVHEERERRIRAPALAVRRPGPGAEEVPGTRRPFHHGLGPSHRAPLHAHRPRRSRLPTRPQRSRCVSLHAWHPSFRLSRQALDDAAVRRLRHAGGDQRPLQGAAAGGRHRAERRLRSADADGPRSGPRAVARRGRQVRRQHRLARRHGAALRGHQPRRHHDVDDDQLAGADDLRDVPGRGRKAGRGLEAAVGDHPERHPQGIHRAEGVHLPAARIDAAHHRHLHVLRARSAALEYRVGQRLSHP